MTEQQKESDRLVRRFSTNRDKSVGEAAASK
eukprot:CAMPEP_0119397604 /NCGR_PEP_ID=MMETSP1334-20130426/140420_1 /TAXON_ID=127549 /ORGANISM="Calcidiscus leptoporus, Strain RCC1130" /LENGTH=30 /DNA_ID= /DNA_START= /DNA_END= /DNA_ORIENTATION=